MGSAVCKISLFSHFLHLSACLTSSRDLALLAPSLTDAAGATLSPTFKLSTRPGSLPHFHLWPQGPGLPRVGILFSLEPRFLVSKLWVVKSPERSKGNLLSSLSNRRVRSILDRYHYISSGLIRSPSDLPIDSRDPSMDTCSRLKGFGVSQISRPMDGKGVPKQL